VTQAGESGRHTPRLFFALWPSDRERQALAIATGAAVAQVDGQAVAVGNLHVTLAFLGAVPGETVARLIEIGGQADGSAMALEFERLEFWPKSKVLVAIPTVTPVEGVELVDRLWQRIEPLGIEREKRPWHPHLTLVRRVQSPPPEGLRISAGPPSPPGADRYGLTLVESTTHASGARYKAIAEWSLGHKGE